jgi:hypothetical protein
VASYIQMSTKASSQSKHSRVVEEAESATPKPLATTILQEIQNLKDKFKNDEDNQEKGNLSSHKNGNNLSNYLHPQNPLFNISRKQQFYKNVVYSTMHP